MRTFNGESVDGLNIQTRFSGNGVRIFTLGGVEFEIPVPGRHNVENALASIALGRLFGDSLRGLRRSLRRFQGIERRFIRVGEVRGITVVDGFRAQSR